MKDLNYQLKQLCQRNRDGSHGSQARRRRDLSLVADQLHQLGYRQLGANSLKQKHVAALVKRWQNEQLSVGTIKNRMVSLRWWAEKIGKNKIISKSNEAYGIPNRKYVTNESKARTLTEEQLAKIKDVHIRMSLRLQAAFGLRREECIKINPHQADRGDHLVLQASWTKGGKARPIPIRNHHQREILNQAKALVGKGYLIPPSRNYIEHLRIYERHTANAGLSTLHGLRHAYAQTRYRELTGWAAPAAGGPDRRALTAEQKAIDRHARLAVSKALGHERRDVVAVYLGS